MIEVTRPVGSRSTSEQINVRSQKKKSAKKNAENSRRKKKKFVSSPPKKIRLLTSYVVYRAFPENAGDCPNSCVWACSESRMIYAEVRDPLTGSWSELPNDPNTYYRFAASSFLHYLPWGADGYRF